MITAKQFKEQVDKIMEMYMDGIYTPKDVVLQIHELAQKVEDTDYHVA